MEATSREAAPAKSSASGPSAPPALFELCGRAVSAHMGVLESGVWGKSRSEGLPPAASGGGPAARGRGGRGREARGKAQPGALGGRLLSRSMKSVTDRAGQSEDRDQMSQWTPTAACPGGAGVEARRPGVGRSCPGPSDRGWSGRPERRLGTDTELGPLWTRTLGCGADRRSGMAGPPPGRGRNWQARPEAGRPGPGPPKLSAQGLRCLR